MQETAEIKVAAYRCNRCGEIVLIDPEHKDLRSNTFSKQHRHSDPFGPPNIGSLGLYTLVPSE